MNKQRELSKQTESQFASFEPISYLSKSTLDPSNYLNFSTLLFELGEHNRKTESKSLTSVH